MPSRRQERVNSRLIQEISTILRTLKDARLGFVTVVRSEVSPDMRHANIFVSVYGEEEVVRQSMEILQAATKVVRKELGKVMQMKSTPEIQFRLEHGIRIADEMNYLISKARSTDPNPGPAPEETAEDAVDGLDSDSAQDAGDFDDVPADTNNDRS